MIYLLSGVLIRNLINKDYVMVLLSIDTITIAICTVVLEYSTYFDDSTGIYIIINLLAVIAVESSISLSMIIKHKTSFARG